MDSRGVGRHVLAAGVLLLLAGCESCVADSTGLDSGSSDAARPVAADAGRPDTGAPPSPSPDAGFFDTGVADSGAEPGPEDWEWIPISTTGAPRPFQEVAAVWTGVEMMVFGSDAADPITAGAYDPARDRWRRLSNTGAPSRRHGHTAVWTGREVIVWGGAEIFDPNPPRYNNGAIYDPEADRWRPMSTVDAPAPRLWHTAVWTGSEMIVWGGFLAPGSGVALEEVASYDPVLDRWTRTPTRGPAPAGIDHHVAVWTGARMLVWGDDGFGARGGLYDPLDASWTPIDTATGPRARRVGAGAWTGSAFLMWGGTDGEDETDEGGLYDPVSQQWRLLSRVNAPAPRRFHTAVWSGEELIVWGGSSSRALEATGGHYDPLTDRWRPTASRNAPSARALHAAVWTGSEMIVWGGSGANGRPAAAGAIYRRRR